ncbi:MAG: Electron transfer flavoprotein subunit beta [Dehalococcoidales bacterium]|nr:Electron transfer flavoprotein subunit beta [Dehalococcoidales bacterium]
MHIIVCVKQVPDPEIPPARFKIDSAARMVIPPVGVSPVMSVFDERAVEAACRLKDKYHARITVLTMGSGKVSDVVRQALSMGGDEGVVLQDAAFDNADSYGTAYLLSKAIQKIGQYDLILCGRQAADWDQGQVGSIIAEILSIPVVTLARDIEVVDGKLRVARVLKDGYEVVEAPMPVVVTVSSELGLPRLPRGMGIITAARKQIPVWTGQDIGANLAQAEPDGAYNEVASLVVPVREARCDIISGETTAEAAANLALKLRELKLI